jgi:replication-associated recombination protein RarA
MLFLNNILHCLSFKQTCSEYPSLKADEIQSLLRTCWTKDEREFQYFGCEMAKMYTKRTSTLCSEDAKESLENLELIKDLITTKSWWDTVDALASHGDLFLGIILCTELTNSS